MSPASGECCNAGIQGCNCGADEHNARIDSALADYRQCVQG